MNHTQYSVVLTTPLSLLGVSIADEGDKNTRPLQLTVERSDGSHIIGHTSAESLVLRSALSYLDAPILPI